jgi:hypothetical protein
MERKRAAEARTRLERELEGLRAQATEMDTRHEQLVQELGELRRASRVSEVALAEAQVASQMHRERADAEATKVSSLQEQASKALAKLDSQGERLAFLKREAADARGQVRAKDGEIEFMRQRLTQEQDERRAAQAELRDAQVKAAERNSEMREVGRLRQENETLLRRCKCIEEARALGSRLSQSLASQQVQSRRDSVSETCTDLDQT